MIIKTAGQYSGQMMNKVLYVISSYSLFIVVISIAPLSTLSSESLNSVNVFEIRLDYLLHVVTFAVWGTLAVIYANQIAIHRNKALLYLFLTGLLLAVLTEYVQKFLPYRGYNVNDLAGNLIGLVLGYGGVALLSSYLRVKEARLYKNDEQ